MTARFCDHKHPTSKVLCELQSGHEGYHIHFGATGTTVWGLTA